MRIREYFIQDPDGSWGPRVTVIIKGPTGGEMRMPSGQRLRPGLKMVGLDLAQLCEEDGELDNIVEA